MFEQQNSPSINFGKVFSKVFNRKPQHHSIHGQSKDGFGSGHGVESQISLESSIHEHYYDGKLSGKGGFVDNGSIVQIYAYY